MNDITIVRSVISWLGRIAFTGLLGIIFLVHNDAPVASIAVVATIAGGAAGSMGTLLATTGTKAMPTQQVEVVNAPDAAVPVDAQP